ncbi:MAG TPA: hypothetical protein DIS94_10065 [Bacteroidetes bacterium]|nr:hypothetical protein [Bacteroidota bacterium]
MPGRGNNPDSYRYGFNGMEEDNSLKGPGNSYDFGARMYDSRLGRWMSVDPLDNAYPYSTPYSGIGNNPISFIDSDGEKISGFWEYRNNHQVKLLIMELEKYTGLKLEITRNGLKYSENSGATAFSPSMRKDLMKYIDDTNKDVKFSLTSKNGCFYKEDVVEGRAVSIIYFNFEYIKKMQDNVRGKYLDKRTVGAALTFMHELGHWFIPENEDLVRVPDQNPNLMSSVQGKQIPIDNTYRKELDKSLNKSSRKKFGERQHYYILLKNGNKVVAMNFETKRALETGNFSDLKLSQISFFYMPDESKNADNQKIYEIDEKTLPNNADLKVILGSEKQKK